MTNTEKALKHYKAIQRALEECRADNDVVMFTREAVVALEKQIASEKSFSEAKKMGLEDECRREIRENVKWDILTQNLKRRKR